MSQAIYQIVDKLPEKNLTTRMLGALDSIVPGEWKNIVGFENTIKLVTGAKDQARIQKIGERAIALYNDKTQGYQTGLWLYQTVDSVQGLGGMASFLNKIGSSVGFLSFLQSITPSPETTQAVDFGVKLVTEIVAFCKINGIPGDGIGDFVESLADCRHEALMRMAALICVDGVLPLGPHFMDKALSMLDSSGVSGLAQNKAFGKISSMIPGGSTEKQLGYIKEGVTGVQGWMKSFVDTKQLTTESVTEKLRGVVSNVGSKADWIAAAVDVSTNYFEHTGTQTVARSLISRAAAEV
ncbi:MAG: hypothetical protein JSS02_29895 [Planctomycetes bacterium]|nr:hypothetical protein [Planctomycetota bacterium]